jgi:YVTN family beta-propeller protein
VSSEVGGTVDIVDAKAYKVLKTLKMPEGAKPMGVALSPDGKRLYVANGRAGTVSLVDLGTDSVVASTKVGTRPWGIALTPDGRKLYAANGPRTTSACSTPKHAGDQDHTRRRAALGRQPRQGAVIRPTVALLLAAAAGAGAAAARAAFRFEPDAQVELRRLWSASRESGMERVACLGGR